MYKLVNDECHEVGWRVRMRAARGKEAVCLPR